MIWFLLQKVGFFIFLFLTIYFVARRKYESLMALSFWGAAFMTCYYYAFTIWYPGKVTALGMLACLALYGRQRNSKVLKIIEPVSILFLGALVLSDVVGLMFPGEFAPRLNRYVRMVNNNYTYISALITLYFGVMMKKGFVDRLVPSYCLAVEVAIAFGFIHYLCLKLGVSFMPILRLEGVVNLEAATEMGGTVVRRVYGVSGEPKNLGFLICPYLFASLVMYSRRSYRINPRYHAAMLFLGCLVLFNTYSSAVYICFALVLPCVFSFLPILKVSPKKIMLALMVCLGGCAWLINDALTVPDGKKDGYLSALYERSFGRAQNEMENDRQEAVVLGHYIKETNPIQRICGWGIAQYTFHVPGQSIGSALIPLQSGFVLTIADFGIFGLSLLVGLACLIFSLLRKSAHTANVSALAFSTAALCAFIGSLMYGNLTSCIPYLMLALYSYYDELEQPKNLHV
ncbi:MAG: hypothetical protein LUG84_00065 [Akkermansiaceae bacterium]|nr:hypothetical protein [Akkermansiaceae bacterium]